MQVRVKIFTYSIGALMLGMSIAVPALSTLAPDSLAFSIGIAPRISALGGPRSLFVNGCSGPATLDESPVASTGTLVIRIAPTSIGCFQQTTVLNYMPRSTGALRVIMMKPDGNTVAEASMQTVASVRSFINIDGMWFDPDTNGSGVSFHHAVGSDTVFATWFMFGQKSRAYSASWYSLQAMQWTQDGNVLVGIVYEAKAASQLSTPPSCAKGDECPRPATEIKAVGTVTASLIDQNNMRVVAYDQYDRQVFVSVLKRIVF